VSLWSSAESERTVACVAQMLGDACSLGDARACAFAGRLWIDGRAVARDPGRGIEMLVRACDAGERLACVVAVHWLAEAAHARDVPDASDLRKRLEEEHACLTSEPEACYQVGLLFYFGADSYPRDRARAAQAYERGCDLGDARACNNLGDALAYGEGVERDVARSEAMFDKACRLGEALGCANSGYMFEHGEGVQRDRPRARALYREACSSGEVYGCLHAEMLSAQDAGTPRDPERALAAWQSACSRRDAHACAFVGVVYEDGPDGLARDSAKSLDAMTRACSLGYERACEWVKTHPNP
jgi:TPR repeat protein